MLFGQQQTVTDGPRVRIFISAGEASSDIHGAALARALQDTAPPGTRLELVGMGGGEMARAGVQIWVDSRSLAAMGVVEVLRLIPKSMIALSTLVKKSKVHVPDVAVLLDFPDFHFRLAPHSSASGSGSPGTKIPPQCSHAD